MTQTSVDERAQLGEMTGPALQFLLVVFAYEEFSVVPRSVCSGLPSLIDKIQFVCLNTRMCRSAWEKQRERKVSRAAGITARSFSPSSSSPLSSSSSTPFSCSCATSHRFPVAADAVSVIILVVRVFMFFFSISVVLMTIIGD